MIDDQQAITLGHPSYVWREGQERRFRMILAHASLENARVLDVGCGLGLYVRRFRQETPDVHGIDIDPARVAQASETLPNIRQGSAQALPYPDSHFDVILSNEVIEHLDDDAAAIRDAVRTLKPGAKLFVFAPNRGYPFETHGLFWRGEYHYGNIPLINYLPDRLRERLASHVRAYRRREIRALFEGLPGSIIAHRVVFAGYDNIIARRPLLGRALQRITYALEGGPLQCLGLSHFVVFAKNHSQRPE